jgi:bifunctional non-homologous end joining protein LigD
MESRVHRAEAKTCMTLRQLDCAVCTKVEHFAVIDAAPRHGPVRSLKLARLAEGKLTQCGWVGSGLTEVSARKIRTVLEAGRPILTEVVYRGFTPAGEIRHPSLKSWQAG